MIYSSEFLSAAWFDIYKQVLFQNAKLGDQQMKSEQLTAVATTIFIQAGQRGFLKPAPFDAFTRELLKITGKVKDRQIQKTIYESVKMLASSNGVKGVV
ncbi:MAG: hypothetical protein HN936_16935 [Bacteroidetes bacterium]|jgi:hypothetical protein|nr:hypothetical protein [Bacteroidota bacterium]